MKAFLALIAVLASGCIAQGGGHFGFASNPSGSARRTWAGHAQARLDVQELVGWPVHFGGELEGRNEADLGSLLLGGGQVGATLFAHQPVSLSASLDFGVPMGWGAALSGSYQGVMVEFPFELMSNAVADANKNFRFLGNRPAVAPYLRWRMLHLRPQDDASLDLKTSHEVVVGLSVRTRFFTDLL